jgi:transcriptional repressor NrdR
MLCKRRFTTYERIEDSVKLTVVKKDGSRIPYERNRIIAGIQKACYKRPVSMQQIIELAEEVEEHIYRQPGQEVSSQLIGEIAIALLKKLDKVAYIRFASVYHDFQDLGEFIDQVHEVMTKPEDAPAQKRLFEE